MARKAFKSLPAYKTDIKPNIQDGYEESISRFDILLNGKKWTWVTMLAESGGRSRYCGNATLGALWKIEEDQNSKKLKFVTYIDSDPEYATDIENDGVPEFFARDELDNTAYEIIRVDGSNREPYRFKGTNYCDCPC